MGFIEFQPSKHQQRVILDGLAHTGRLPDDGFVQHARTLHDTNPVRFDHFHPTTLGPLLDRDELQRAGGDCLAQLPLLPGWIHRRHDAHPDRFNFYHSGTFLNRLLKLDDYLSLHPLPCVTITTQPPRMEPVTVVKQPDRLAVTTPVTEPLSALVLGTAMVAGLVLRRRLQAR